MKRCFRCERVLNIELFYRHSRMADGHLNKCKVCTNSDVKRNYRRNIEHYKAYESSRAMLPHRVRSREEYLATPGGKAALRRSLNNYWKKYPLARQAHSAVRNAIRRGHLKKHPCEVCGSDVRIEAHHDDYTRPLDVRWLCNLHHRAVHGKYAVTR